MSLISRPDSKWHYCHWRIGISRVLHVTIADQTKLECVAVDCPLMEIRLHQV